jgi:hypothetical protein
MSSKFRITPKSTNLTFQTIVDRVHLGYELLEKKEDVLTKEDSIKYNDAIIVSPDYQREYRSTLADESSLIESALIGIPIPPIFLASHQFKGVQVLNVVDGQHRIRAFYRFFKNEYGLTKLKLLQEFDGRYFNDLELAEMQSLQSADISTITFREFPGKEFELEIFSRYNQGTKPLTSQEIRHAVYNSSVNAYVNQFCNSLLKDSKGPLSVAYAISKDRIQKKTCHENLFVILSILTNGISQKINEDDKEVKIAKSPQFADSYMKRVAELESSDPDLAHAEFGRAVDFFEEFNKFVIALTTLTPHPFSREIYGISGGGNRFQVAISMILAAIFREIYLIDGRNFGKSFNGEKVIRFGKLISGHLERSYLEDSEYKASTTNPVEIEKVVNNFILEFLAR